MSEAKKFTKVEVPVEAGGITYISPKSLSENGITGVIVEGEYLGTQKSQFDNEDFLLLRDDGSQVLINHTGGLAKQMGQVNIGDYLRISYEGKKIMTSGKFKGKSAHQFLVETAS